MRSYEPSEDHQPLLWMGGHGLYATHLLVAGFCVSMIVTAISQFAGAGTMLSLLPFQGNLVLSGQVWRIFTYGLFNPPSIEFAINMVMLVWFGREVEKHFGRRYFLLLYAGIYLLPPLFLTAVASWLPASLHGAQGALAVFVAFATLYPNVPLMFNVLAKWAAVILVGIYSLMALAGRDVAWLSTLWLTVGFAYGFVRYQRGEITLPRLRIFRRQPRLRVLPDARPARSERPAPAPAGPARSVASKEATMVEIDALLDKIAKSGLSSLTAKERARLDSARNDLRRRKSSS